MRWDLIQSLRRIGHFRRTDIDDPMLIFNVGVLLRDFIKHTAINIERLDLLPNRLYLVGKAGQMADPIDATKFFQHVPLIFREKGSGTRQVMERFISEQNISVVKKMELTSNEAVKQAVLAGLGYSIMPLIGIRNELANKELGIIPVRGLPIQTTWSLIWLKGKKHAQASCSFLEFVNQHKSAIIAQNFGWCDGF